VFTLNTQADILQDQPQPFVRNAEGPQFWTGGDRPTLVVDRYGSCCPGCGWRDQQEICDRYEEPCTHICSNEVFKSQRGSFISLLSRYFFEIRASRDDSSLVFDDVLAKAKGIAVLKVRMCQNFSRYLYGDDVEQELPFPPDCGNLQYKIAGIGREILTNQE
jgi:hypothetical protein